MPTMRVMLMKQMLVVSETTQVESFPACDKLGLNMARPAAQSHASSGSPQLAVLRLSNKGRSVTIAEAPRLDVSVGAHRCVCVCVFWSPGHTQLPASTA